MGRKLPPLNACRVFEAAARLGSFAHAAEELHVTPTAVSHQVALLEHWVGHRLFRRRHNGVVATDTAKTLLPLLSDALRRISVGIETVSQAGPGGRLTISAQPNFALKWLIPRLSRFAACYPALELRLVTDYRALDLANEEIDVAVRYLDQGAISGRSVPLGTEGELAIDHLFRAELLPIASPALFPPGRRYEPEALAGQVLLHVLPAPDDWPQWLAAAGLRSIDATRGPKFDSYALSGEAAVHGWGVAIGRAAFVAEDIAAGRLTAPFSLRLPGTTSWYLLTPRRAASPRITAFREWILDEAALSDAAHANREEKRRRVPR